TIAQTLDIRERAGEPLVETVASALRGRQLLLFVDNFEQVLPAAPEVATLLAGAPGLSVLVTSRTPLHIRGEHEFPVPPLVLPNGNGGGDGRSIAQAAAVSPFVERAQPVRHKVQTLLTH